MYYSESLAHINSLLSFWSGTRLRDRTVRHRVEENNPLEIPCLAFPFPCISPLNQSPTYVLSAVAPFQPTVAVYNL